MKRTICIIALVFCALAVAAIAAAQDKPQQAAPTTVEAVRIDAATQQEIAELKRQSDEAKTVLAAATAQSDAAEQRFLVAVYKAMAKTGCPPEQCKIASSRENGIHFEKKPALAGARTSPAKATPSGSTSKAKPPLKP